MSRKTKVWNGSSIRELARKKMAETKTPAPMRPQVPLSHRSSTESFEFQFGEFQNVRGDRVVAVTWENETRGPDDWPEIVLLCRTLGLQVVDLEFLPDVRKPDPATGVGRGTLERLGLRMQATGAVALVLDKSVTPSQLKNIETILQAPLLDRHSVILGIFEKHSQTKEAQLQVELAQLKYLQPRLAGIWKGLSRQRGGRGGLKGRGGGETRLELDRRTVKERLRILTRKLEQMDRSFEVQAASRKNLPRAALVGYTNAGKSSLMRALTKAPVEAEDLLFKTLSTTVRPLSPPTHPRILVSDTVGFIRDLPPDLVASFRSTLAESLSSTLILHVVDASHPSALEQFETTETTLESLGGKDIPKLLVLNKSDRLSWGQKKVLWDAKQWIRDRPSYVGVVLVSAKEHQGLQELREAMMTCLRASLPAWSQNNPELGLEEAGDDWNS